MTTTTTAGVFKLTLNDFWKGAIVATISAPVTIILESINAGKFTIDWKHILMISVAGFLSYMVKNFLTPASINIQTDPATIEKVKDGVLEPKLVTPPSSQLK